MTVSLFVRWNISKDYDVGATVSHGAYLYRCVKYAPAGTPVSDPNYWLTQGDGTSGEGGSTPLPENIVIDPDYVHTDNNYDNAAAEKLAGLQNYDDTSVNEAISSETARAAAAETALTPKSWNWDYVMRNMQMQNDADSVIIATTWGFLDTDTGAKTEQPFTIALPFADTLQAGIMSKEQSQQILDNTSAIGTIQNAGYVNGDALQAEVKQAKEYAESLLENIETGFFVYKGDVATFADLPTGLTAENNGWLYHIEDTGEGYYWFVDNWNQIDVTVDLTDYATQDYVDEKVNAIPKYVLPQATDSVLGGVKSSSTAGKGFVEGSGVISVNGWDSLNAAVASLSNNKQNNVPAGTSGHLITNSGTAGIFGTSKNPADFAAAAHNHNWSNISDPATLTNTLVMERTNADATTQVSNNRGTTQLDNWAAVDKLAKTTTFTAKELTNVTVNGIPFQYSVGLHIEMGKYNLSYAYQLLFDYDGSGVAYRIRNNIANPSWTAWKNLMDSGNASTAAPLGAGTAAAGTAHSFSRGDHVHPAQTTITGNAGTATRLQTARTITLSGAVSGSASIDGSANVSIAITRNAKTMTTLFSGNAGAGATVTLSAALSNYKEVLIVVANGSYRFLWQGSTASLGYVAAGEYLSIPAAYSSGSAIKMYGVDITAASGTLASSTSWTMNSYGATVKYVIGIS